MRPPVAKRQSVRPVDGIERVEAAVARARRRPVRRKRSARRANSPSPTGTAAPGPNRSARGPAAPRSSAVSRRLRLAAKTVDAGRPPASRRRLLPSAVRQQLPPGSRARGHTRLPSALPTKTLPAARAAEPRTGPRSGSSSARRAAPVPPGPGRRRYGAGRRRNVGVVRDSGRARGAGRARLEPRSHELHVVMSPCYVGMAARF